MVELQRRLGLIDAGTPPDTYNFTVGACLRVDEFNTNALRPEKVCIYELMGGQEETQERTTGTHADEFDVFLIASKVWTPQPVQDPYSLQPPTREEQQLGLQADIRTALQAWRDDPQFGALLIAIEDRDWNLGPRVSGQVEWVQVEVRLACTQIRQRNER